MAAGDVARLMSDHADDLVRRLGLEQGAGIDEHAPAGDEGVEGGIVDQNDLDAGAGQSGGFEDRARIVAHQRLDLGVADDRHAALRVRKRDLRESDLRGHKAGKKGFADAPGRQKHDDSLENVPIPSRGQRR